MMKTFFKMRRFGITAAVLALIITLTSSCNHDFDVRIKKHDADDTVSVNMPQKKVLYLIVDGLRGRIIPQINPPTILKMTNNGVYTFDGVSDKNGEEVTSWADMLTGVKSDKHKVTDNSFMGNDLNDFPMFFTRLKEVDSSWKTAAFGSSSLLMDNLVSHADVHKELNDDDEAVKNAVVDELQNDNDVTVVLGEFNNVEAAGNQYGYDSSVTEYVNAIMEVDDNIKDILDALKKRKNYIHEDWLVVVASEKGGPAPVSPGENPNSVFGNPKLNSFLVFYNPRFTSKIVSKPNTANIPYDGYTIKLRDKGDDAINASVPADSANLYNFGSSGDYTVQLKIKIFSWGSVWPSFFGKKSTSQNSSVPGWIFMFHGDNQWRVKIGGSGKDLTTKIQNFATDEWHTLSLKIYEDGGNRYAAIYTDGNKSDPLNITGANMDNSQPLTSGWISGWDGTYSNLYITDVKIWNTAIPDNIIDEEGGNIGLNPTSPYYNNIIGYWPSTDGIGNKFKDEGPYHHDMVFNVTDKNKGAFNWEHFSDLSGLVFPPLPTDLESTVPRGIDIPYMIYKWMGVDASSWNLDGQFWLPGYKDVQ